MTTSNPYWTAPASGHQPPAQPPHATSPHAPTQPPQPHHPQQPAGQQPYAQQPYPGRPPGLQAQPAQRRPRRHGTTVLTSALVGALVATGATLAAGEVVDGTATAATAAAGTAPQAEAPQEDGSDVVPAGGVDWGAVAADVQPGVVAISAQSADGMGGQGSGVVMDADGTILTNNHVVAGAARNGRLQVSLLDGRLFDAEPVGLDAATDLAVIRIVDAPDDLVVASFADSDEVAVGDPVMAIGNPLGLSGTVTTGIVSALDRPTTTASAGIADGAPVVTDSIQTDAAVNPGNSGGALVDADGDVVGINSSIATLGQGGQSGSIGLGFAIPSNTALDVAEQLVADGTAEHARLGVYLADTEVTLTSGELAGTRLGAELAEIIPGSAAEQAGLQAGDVVVAVDSTPVTGSLSLTARVRALQPGDTADLAVVRDGALEQVTVTLTSD